MFYGGSLSQIVADGKTYGIFLTATVIWLSRKKAVILCLLSADAIAFIIIESARPRATFVLEWVLQPTKQKSKTILKRRKSKHAESKTNHAWHNTAYELCKNRRSFGNAKPYRSAEVLLPLVYRRRYP
jgi:hypothetical protein